MACILDGFTRRSSHFIKDHWRLLPTLPSVSMEWNHWTEPTKVVVEGPPIFAKMTPTTLPVVMKTREYISNPCSQVGLSPIEPVGRPNTDWGTKNDKERCPYCFKHKNLNNAEFRVMGKIAEAAGVPGEYVLGTFLVCSECIMYMSKWVEWLEADMRKGLQRLGEGFQNTVYRDGYKRLREQILLWQNKPTKEMIPEPSATSRAPEIQRRSWTPSVSEYDLLPDP